ncbi:unnamed protein product [Rotaria sp. Silwood1]|nr:unnamed protein product [Rotaria sp. Silwood1]
MIIYTRALSLKSTSLKELDTGQIMNLIANDASKFKDLCSCLGYLVEGIVEAIIVFGLLIWILQSIPALCGYALFSVFIFIQLSFGKKFRQYYEITSMCSYKRL